MQRDDSMQSLSQISTTQAVNQMCKSFLAKQSVSVDEIVHRKRSEKWENEVERGPSLAGPLTWGWRWHKRIRWLRRYLSASSAIERQDETGDCRQQHISNRFFLFLCSPPASWGRYVPPMGRSRDTAKTRGYRWVYMYVGNVYVEKIPT